MTQKKKKTKQIEIELEKSLAEIERSKTTILLEEYYYIVKQYAKMVANKHVNGFILYGPGGFGKSYNVIKSFRENKKKFAYLSGHITSLELYHFLHANKNENIILDDINILDNEINLNMLKSCLNDKLRLVSYNSTSSKLKAPSKFIFKGTICLIINDLPRGNRSLKAVERRVLVHELKFKYDDKIKLIHELAKLDYKTISAEKREEFATWIEQNTSQATKNLSLRILFHIYEMYLFDNKGWETLARELLIENEELDLIIRGFNCDQWAKKTGKSIATYYRYKKSLS